MENYNVHADRGPDRVLQRLLLITVANILAVAVVEASAAAGEAAAVQAVAVEVAAVEAALPAPMAVSVESDCMPWLVKRRRNRV